MSNTPRKTRRLERLAAEENFRVNGLSRFADSGNLDVLPEDDSALEEQTAPVEPETAALEKDANAEPETVVLPPEPSNAKSDFAESSDDDPFAQADQGDNNLALAPSAAPGKKELKKNTKLEEAKKNRKKKIILATSGALVLLLAGGGTGYAIWDKERNEVVVPEASSVIENEEALDETCEPFTAIEIDCEATIESSEEVDRGALISQSIEAGAEVDKRDANIALVYSSGPEVSVMPNVSRMTLEEATAELEGLGLVIDQINYFDNPDFEKGRVIKSSIAPDTEVTNGEKVNLDVASGSVTLPDWTGKTRDEVAAEAQQLGLTVNYTDKESENPPGTVISQSPAAGEPSEGNEVTVTLSKAAESKDVAVPDVVGMTQEEAQTELASAGFKKISTASVENGSVTESQVTQVVPGPGNTVSTEEQIVIIVSVPPAAAEEAPAPSDGGGE